MLTLMLPGQVTIVPQYILFNYFGFVDSYVPLILPHFFGGGAFFIFLLVQFIRGIPMELDEAAKIDGAAGLAHADLPCRLAGRRLDANHVGAVIGHHHRQVRAG